MRNKKCLWIIALLVTFLLSACKKEYEIPEYIKEQMSLEKELEQWEDVYQEFHSDTGYTRVYDNPQEVAGKYVPEGAEVIEVCATEDVVYISYRIERTSYMVSYVADGVVSMTLREGHSDLVYSAQSDEEEIKVYDLEANRKTYTNWWIRIFG